MALVKALLISPRPPPKPLDRIVIVKFDDLKSRRLDGKQMGVHVNYFRHLRRKYSAGPSTKRAGPKGPY